LLQRKKRHHDHAGLSWLVMVLICRGMAANGWRGLRWCIGIQL